MPATATIAGPTEFEQLEQQLGPALDALPVIERAWIYGEARRRRPLARAGQIQRLAALEVFAEQLAEAEGAAA